MSFTLYVALGDSMSTDHYPTCDVRGLDVPPVRLDPLGAAALLHRNDDARWPEFRGLDLETLSPDLDFLGLAEDGAMIDDVATEELARIGRDSADPDILLTADHRRQRSARRPGRGTEAGERGRVWRRAASWTWSRPCARSCLARPWS